MNITVYHADHGVSQDLLSWAISQVSESGFFAKTFEIPDHYDSLSNSLYGPSCGDEPIQEDVVYYKQRSSDRPMSRMIQASLRDTRLLTIIGIKNADACIVYTCYGGPLAPREPDDPSLESAEEKQESIDFWSQHALASDSE